MLTSNDMGVHSTYGRLIFPLLPPEPARVGELRGHPCVRVNQKRGVRVSERGAEGGMTAERGYKHDIMQRERSCRSNRPFSNLLILLHLQTPSLNTEPRVANAKYRGLQI